MVACGAVGLSYLNVWVSVAFIVLFVAYFFVIMPLTLCKYCYFKTDADLKEWEEKYLQLHTKAMKKWGMGIFIVWLVPVIGIVVSFFVNFSVVAVICLVGFVAFLLWLPRQLSQTICSHCAIVEMCPLRQQQKNP